MGFSYVFHVGSPIGAGTSAVVLSGWPKALFPKDQMLNGMCADTDGSIVVMIALFSIPRFSSQWLLIPLDLFVQHSEACLLYVEANDPQNVAVGAKHTLGVLGIHVNGCYMTSPLS